MKGNYGVKADRVLVLIVLLAAAMLQGCSKMGKEEVIDEVELTDTVRWFNTSYALLTEMNKWDYNLFGGAENTEENQKQAQKMLDRYWGVTDRESADQTLDWVLKEGQRGNFVNIMQTLEQDGVGALDPEERPDFLTEQYNMDEKSSQLYAQWYGMYEEYGEGAIDGWDSCRAMSLPGYYYLAGYYTKEEALDKSLEIAAMVQSEYDSWDELMDSYLRGYEFWAEESSDKRREVYEKLKKKSKGPYKVEFAMELEKTW